MYSLPSSQEILIQGVTKNKCSHGKQLSHNNKKNKLLFSPSKTPANGLDRLGRRWEKGVAKQQERRQRREMKRILSDKTTLRSLSLVREPLVLSSTTGAKAGANWSTKLDTKNPIQMMFR
jgi:hypothetical protein